MESKKYYRFFLLRTIVFILPVSVLFFYYTASKLHTHEQSSISTIMIIFLFLYTLFICYRDRFLFHFSEAKYVVLFFILSLMAYLTSTFTSIESYVRFFALISFVPLGFMSGLSWGYHINMVGEQKKDRILFILTIPAIVSALMIANSTIFALFSDDASRDYVFGVVLFLPFLLYYRNNIWPILFLTIAAYICIISAKRTGLLCMAIVIFIFAIIKVGIKNSKKSGVVTTILVASIVVFIAYNYLPDISSQWGYSIERFNNMDDESNEVRMVRYGHVLDEIESSSIFEILFGHGCYASVLFFGSPIHNDWLEITFDYGIFPLFCIISLFISLLVRVLKTIKKDFSSSMVLLATLLVFFITTIGNCMFTSYITVFVLLFTLGFALSNLRYHVIIA